MKAFSEKQQAEVVTDNGRSFLLMQPDQPDKQLFLRYALVRQGTEELVYPRFILDDWGNEVPKAEMFDWIKEYGWQFPRAEIFGLDEDGEEGQWFLREFELYAKWRCVASPEKNTPIPDCWRIEAVLWPEDVAEVVKVKRPLADQLNSPLRKSYVTWWHVPANQPFDLKLINPPKKPDF